MNFGRGDSLDEQGVTPGVIHDQSAFGGTAESLTGLFGNRFSNWIKRNDLVAITELNKTMQATDT
jgi:hypothetical protein